MSEEEDITLEFYFKKADYVSEFTKAIVPIEIKRVVKHICGGSGTYILSSHNVWYRKSDLSNFRI